MKETRFPYENKITQIQEEVPDCGGKTAEKRGGKVKENEDINTMNKLKNKTIAYTPTKRISTSHIHRKTRY